MNEWARWMRHSLGAGCTAVGLVLAMFAWWDQLGFDEPRPVGGPAHVANWYWGWTLLGAAFLTGSAVGLSFFEEDFWGGYSSFRRRAVRLGHVSLATMGLVNVLYGISPWPEPYTSSASMAGLLFVLGGILLPATFFVAAWRPAARFALGLPALLLVTAVLFTIRGGDNRQAASEFNDGFLRDDSAQFRSMFYNPDLFKALPHPKDPKKDGDPDE